MTQKQEKRICSHFSRSLRNGRLDTVIVGFAHQQVGGSEHPNQASLGGRGRGCEEEPWGQGQGPIQAQPLDCVALGASQPPWPHFAWCLLSLSPHFCDSMRPPSIIPWTVHGLVC